MINIIIHGLHGNNVCKLVKVRTSKISHLSGFFIQRFSSDVIDSILDIVQSAAGTEVNHGLQYNKPCLRLASNLYRIALMAKVFARHLLTSDI